MGHFVYNVVLESVVVFTLVIKYNIIINFVFFLYFGNNNIN